MKSDFNFNITAEDKNSKARCGVIKTAHGDIMTPSFIPVGTKASVKSLDNNDLENIGSQIFFVNTYHMFLRPGMEIIEKFKGLHNFIGWNKPLITDSGGFQVFSLAREKRRPVVEENEIINRPFLELVKISDDGVKFRSLIDGSVFFFDAKKSIEVQSILGADIMISFDECAPYPSTYEYAEKAMQRTHRWAEICLYEKSKIKDQRSKIKKVFQALYGVVQGGTYEDLRKQSAKFISSLPFDGIAIGGVAVGESKKEARDVLDWVMPDLPDNKPRHLLGVGEIDDIFEMIERGVDSFDCVMPTRLGRMGLALKKCKVMEDKWTIDITKSEFAEDKNPIDLNCNCFVCKNYSRAYLHHLFKSRELTVYRLISYHNLYFIENLVRNIRASIKEGSFMELKKQWLDNQ